MMQNIFFTLFVLFQSALGEVTDTDLINSLKLMLFGMVGILIVMIFIWIVIAVLNRLPGKDNKQGK